MALYRDKLPEDCHGRLMEEAAEWAKKGRFIPGHNAVWQIIEFRP